MRRKFDGVVKINYTMALNIKALYQPKVPEGDTAGMIRIKSAGDFFAKTKAPKGCCGFTSAWVEYSARVKIPAGILTSEIMETIAQLARKYGRGEIYLTSRLGIEIPGIAEESFSDFQQELAQKGLMLAGCGHRMRPVVACKGTVCVNSNLDTFRLAWEIDQQYYDGLSLPNKFKIGLAGCPIGCSKPNLNDVGFTGVYRPVLVSGCIGCQKCVQECPCQAIGLNDTKVHFNYDHCLDCGHCSKVCPEHAIMASHTGMDLYVGGRWGRVKQIGIRIARFLSETEALELIGHIRAWYRENGQSGERLGQTILNIGIRKFQKDVLREIDQEKWADISLEAEAGFQVIRPH